MNTNPEKIPQSRPGMEDLLYGLFLIALAAFVFLSTQNLTTGTPKEMGPGYFPKALALITFGFGLLFTIRSFFMPGPKIAAPHWRGVILVCLSTTLFAALLMSLGLLICSFLAMFIGSLASPETRLREVFLFSAAISGGTVLLFVKALAMPVPIFPW